MNRLPKGRAASKQVINVKNLVKQEALVERHKRTVHHEKESVKNHYTILPGNAGVLHSGPHATVYKGRHKRSNVFRAVKQVRAEDVDIKKWMEEVAVMQPPATVTAE